jgi:tetratricopeptide (TPR) repeat protein
VRTIFLYLLAGLLSIFTGAVFCGCADQEAIRANQQSLQAQQTELDQLEQQVAAMQSQPHSYKTAAVQPGSCDLNVMREATRKGGERFAANDLGGALNYYQDAMTACPSSARVQLNIARTYEAVGDRSQAIAHYRLAAQADRSDSDSQAVQAAREALNRLGG